MDTVENNSEDVSQRVQFHFIKSNYFRVIKIDGGIGGITPRAEVHLTLFSERLPIPEMIEHEVTEDGKLGNAARIVTKNGLVREIEADVILTPTAAKEIGEWLLQKSNEATQLIENAERDQEKLASNQSN